MIWATVSSRSCFCWLYTASPPLAAKNIINLISVWTIWWSPRVESSLVLLERVFAMTSVFSWKNSVHLCPALFCTLKSKLSVNPGIAWLPTLHSNPLWWKGYLFFPPFGISSRRSFVNLHRTSQLQLLKPWWLGHRLWLLWCLLACLGNKLKSFCHFWDCTQIPYFRLFCWLWGIFYFF